MNWLRKYWETFKASRKSNAEKYVKECAKRTFQITEYNGRFWFTYNGSRFCPCDMMKEEPIDALSELRSLYINELL